MFPSNPALKEPGAVNAPDSVVLVCAPPLLLMVTPGATWVLEDVVPDVLVVPVAVVSVPVPVPVDVDSLVEVEPVVVAMEAVEVSVVDASADPVDDSVDVEPAEFVDDDPEDVPVESALATPGEVTTITPIPKAAASAPTRPM